MLYEIIVRNQNGTTLDVFRKQINSGRSDRDARKWARDVARDSDHRWTVELFAYELTADGPVLVAEDSPSPVLLRGKPYILCGAIGRVPHVPERGDAH